MKRFLMKAFVLLLRLIYAPIRCRRVRDKVTIISRQSDQPSVDIKMLSDYLQLRYPRIECVVLCRFIGDGIAGKIRYAPHMITQMRQIASSRVVVLDGYCITACVLHHKPETKILQMWHAVAAVKKFGYQSIGRSAGRSAQVAEAMCMHRNYDYILCPGPEMGRIFCEAFRARPDQLLYMGLPRLDLIWNSADTASAIRSAYGIPQSREMLLYLPTFRKGKPVRLKELIRSIDPDRFTLVVRLHPLDSEPSLTDADRGDLQVIFDRSRSTQEWIRACDRMITDYSALGVEATLTGKPLYFYLYDVSEYEQAVGLNIDPRAEMPHAAAITGLQLSDLLAKPYDYDELYRFRDKYISIDTDACTARLGDFIYGIIKEVYPQVSDASSDAESQGS
ncbi:MAG: CDP-glycerol glycerophosphotransferase family protein [Firmicutes bacterium]|nr:CDP-glycerol glycerophosphotransferase family protein [Bacillota bacterium]